MWIAGDNAAVAGCALKNDGKRKRNAVNYKEVVSVVESRKRKERKAAGKSDCAADGQALPPSGAQDARAETTSENLLMTSGGRISRRDSRVPDVVVGKLQLTEGTMKLEAEAPVTKHPHLSQDVIGGAARTALEDSALITADALTPQTVAFVRTRDSRVLLGDVEETESLSTANASGFPPPSQGQPASDRNLVAKLCSKLKELQAEIENLTRSAEDNQKKALIEATKIEKVCQEKEKELKEE